MKYLSVLLLFVFSTPYSVFAAAAPGTLPTRVEIEQHLAKLDQQAAIDVLHAMDPSRKYDVLVKVTLDPMANWDELGEQPVSDENYLPGTIRKNVEITQEMRERVFQTLPRKREVLVLTPLDAPGDIEKSAGSWVGRKLGLKTTDTVSFQHKLKEHEPEPPPSKDGFFGSRDYWRALIAASAFVASVFLLLLFIVVTRAGARKEAEKAPPQILPLPVPNEATSAFDLPPPVEKPEPPPAPKSEKEPDVSGRLAAVVRIASFNPELSSLAFMGLVSRADDLEITAKVIQALGMDQALHLFPKVTGASWARLGAAIAELDPSALTLEECLDFERALNGEMARMQHHAVTSKLLPNLEAKGPGEIVTQLRGAGPVRGSTLMALLSDSAISEVAPKLSNRELASILKTLPGVSAVPVREIERFDKGEMLAEVQNQTMPIEPFAKMAAVLSALAPADEFVLFENLLASANGDLIAQIAPYRLYPAHIGYLPREIVSMVVQSMDLDHLRGLIASVKGNIRASLMSYMSQRQKDTLEDSAGDGGPSPEVLREFLNECHSRLGQLGSSEQIVSIFKTERAA